MAKRPTDDEIEVAITWLQYNEGDGGESDACARVAAWLEAEIAERMIRSLARKNGVPVAAVRARLASKGEG